MSVIKINKENFASEVLNSNKPVLLDFYADWCGPCRMVGPIVSEIAKYACNACEMGGDFDGDCHDLIGEYTTCGICQGTANKIYDDFICKYIEELNEKDRQVQHLLRVCKILEIALNNALGLDYLYTDAYSEAEKEYEAEEAKRNTENK